MLLTNVAVAQQIAVHFSEQALLRRHDPPIERRLVSLYNLTVRWSVLINNDRLLSSSARRDLVTRWT